jgi:Uma2 family endonuclease
VPWPEQGSWTWDDYCRLPEDGQRFEIIHGVLYISPAPIYLHQLVVARLVRLLSNFVIERRLGVVLAAPFDVLLPGVAQPVQPDVLFISSDKQPAEDAANFEGAPDLIIEVLSKRTSRLDRTVKLDAYEKAGVSEYWLVDPQGARPGAVNGRDDFSLAFTAAVKAFGRRGDSPQAPFGVSEPVRKCERAL